MLNPIKEIVKWQHDAGNASKPYNDFLESSFQIEEALEGFSNIDELYFRLNPPDELSTKQARDTSRAIVEFAKRGTFDKTVEVDVCSISDVERLDKACDAIIFAIGSMTKLGLDHHAITKALNIVNDANKQKLNSKRDSLGKLEKPLDFKGPEEKLQELLDSIRR